MKRLEELNKRDFHLLVLNAVLRQPSIEKLAELMERDELEIFDLVKDIQTAIIDKFKIGVTGATLENEIRKAYLTRMKRDEEREEQLKKLRYKEWRQKNKLP